MSGVVQYLVLSLLAAGAGVSFVAQQAVNANLRASIGSAAWAGFVSYLGGTICMAVLALILHERWPAGAALVRSNWWAWSGGFFGAVKSISGIVQYYDLVTSEAFAGITVNGTKLTQDTVGINYVNIAKILTIPHLVELNIGHAIVSRAMFAGLETAVREMLNAMKDYSKD